MVAMMVVQKAGPKAVWLAALKVDPWVDLKVASKVDMTAATTVCLLAAMLAVMMVGMTEPTMADHSVAMMVVKRDSGLAATTVDLWAQQSAER